jgi:hypothetical protein
MYMGAPPFAEREPFTQEAVHNLERKDKREIIHEKDRPSRRMQPQVEEDIEALPRHPQRRRRIRGEGGYVRSVTMVNGTMFSALIG